MNFSFQLYSARNFQPWSDVLAMLASAGYRNVEGFGGVYEDASGFRKLMDQNGLAMPSGHFSLDALEGDIKAVFETASALGIQRIYCPNIAADLRPADKTGWQAFAARLSAVGEKVRAAGFGFGWHNHDFEFVPLGDGSVPMQILLETAPELEWEADIAWVIRGGADAADWIDRFGSRITAVHVKDIAPAGEAADEDGWADVSYGTVDWAAMFAQLKAGTPATLFIMEHDNPSDVGRFASRSLDWCRGGTE
ncbi:sugar phosphate isomerase/epimerase [Hoeflea sp. YIM 152468]|uniref:sugar phosphate isomerase/epimerase family protein n=1 Tax=Hoeflea sp. YIM 152468 TaxID=3031759 RepID=UPI0023DC2DBB|nr:sugar phosphate isomerase/epimerase [Hoeflea sp. YIM 152468]MDF1610387.1 sugar phosphate isomerase/epimerase [Hoeflea sp. YIM 152468]